MATSATPYGARPINTTSASGSFTGKVQHIKIASAYGTAIFYGDFVKLVTAGTIEKDTGTTACTPIGIFLGCKYTDPSTNQMTFNQTWPASTAASDAAGYVLTDPREILRDISSIDDQHVVSVGKFVDEDVINDCAMLGQQCRILGIAHLE